jgi:hypothetical protein
VIEGAGSPPTPFAIGWASGEAESEIDGALDGVPAVLEVSPELCDKARLLLLTRLFGFFPDFFTIVLFFRFDTLRLLSGPFLRILDLREETGLAVNSVAPRASSVNKAKVCFMVSFLIFCLV